MKGKYVALGALLLLMYRANPLYGINIKQGSYGVVVKVIRPEISEALSTARIVFNSFGEGVTVTDWWRNDPNSLHFYNLAVDIRANDIDPTKHTQILAALRLTLGSSYQVVLHGIGNMIHFHIEYDPLREGVRSFQTT